MSQNSDVDSRIAVNTAKDEKTFVVIISNENYKHEESVPFARNDGDVFRLYCQKTLGIPERNIHYSPDATLNEMNFELDWLDDVLKAYDGEARAIVYYTGHGMPDEGSKEAYLLPVDGYSKSPSSGLSTAALYKKLGAMQTSSVMVFLDACFSGAKRDGKMLASSRGVAIKAKNEPLGRNTVVFSAAQGDETAYPYKSRHHGLFTYFILDKLQQTGGATTLGELSDYVTKEVKRNSVVENGKSQTPSVVAASGNQSWRDWQFSSTAATRYEVRKAPVHVASASPAPSSITNSPSDFSTAAVSAKPAAPRPAVAVSTVPDGNQPTAGVSARQPSQPSGPWWRYEGDRNTEGLPHGNGKVYITQSTTLGGREAVQGERIEGLFRNGYLNFGTWYHNDGTKSRLKDIKVY